MTSSLAVRNSTFDTVAPVPAVAAPPIDPIAPLLRDLARMTRDALGVERASILLLDEAGRLTPAVSVAVEEQPARWSRFRALPALDTAGLPLLRELLRAGRVVVLDDARGSGLVPQEWCDEFGLTSLAVAPLPAEHGPAGLLVVDHGARRHRFTDDELHRLGGLARGAGAALHTVRAQEEAAARGRLAERALELAAGIDDAPDAHAATGAAVDAIRELFAAPSVSVVLFEGDELVTLASSGAGQPEPGRRRLPRYSSGLDDVRALWRTDPTAPVVLDAVEVEALVPGPGRLPSYAVLPLPDPGCAAGFVLAGREHAEPVDDARLAAAMPVAVRLRHALARFAREQELADRAARVELFQRLADEMAVAPDMERALGRLGPLVAAADAETVDAYLCDAELATRFSATAPGPIEALLSAWTRRGVTRAAEIGGLLVVPMVHDDELVGVLRVRPVSAGTAREDALLALATGLAGVVGRVALRTQLTAAECELAVARERERLGDDLHDTVCQTLYAIALQVDGCASAAEPGLRERLDDVRAAVAAAGTEVRQAVQALAFAGCGGLTEALAGEQVLVTGTPVPLAPCHEEALARTAHEALQNARKHGGATVSVSLEYAGDRVVLTVRDDGAGFPADASCREGHFGLRTMHRRMEDAGGGLELRNAVPHGAIVTAWVPAG